MKILVESEIQRSIRRCKPSKIAVAYIGSDWKTYVPDADHLGSVIVSPTFGSNPWAITDLAKQIGWEKILFLEELHAKMYLGDEAAVIGSANLTHNGLSGEVLVELCVEVNSEESLLRLDGVFEGLKKEAQMRYPTTETKKARLKELEKSWGAAIANKIIRPDNRNSRAFSDFEPLGEDHFYVIWYKLVDCEYSDDVKALNYSRGKDIHFANEDKVEKNKWALFWRITDSSIPHKTVNPYWVYIHDVFENGIIKEGYKYPKCAIQRDDLEVPPPPFEITSDVAAAFKKAIQEKEIAKHLIQDDRDVFSLAYSLKGMPLLIRKMKVYITKKTNATDAKKRAADLRR